MEIPNLVRERLGGESIEATVSLGDEDVVCVTPTRTLLYRGDGLLSDETVEAYDHDVERLDLSEGRRNTKFVLEYVDGTEEFKVPGDRTDSLLKILFQGILRVAGVIGDEESVAGVFQFSELTLVVTEARLIKHIGAAVWDANFEVYDYDAVAGLDFEQGSVATQIILTVDGRPQRIKAPNDEAAHLKQTLTQTMCAFYDVGSLEALRGELSSSGAESTQTESTSDDERSSTSQEIELDDGISPLVGDEGDADTGSQQSSQTTATASQQASEATTSTQSAEETTTPASPEATARSPETTTADAGVDPEAVAAVEEQLESLTEAVKRQNDLLREHNERIERNDEKIDQLIEELRQGR